MAHYHVHGYQATGRCEVVALADISRENAVAFAERHNLQPTIFEDYRQMLAEVKPDIVSICTWPKLHAEMVLAAVDAGVRAIHCEKPMAPTWGESKAMHQAAVAAGCQLTFNHQRRFLGPFREARRLARAGAIGEVHRIEAACSNMIDWGTHWLDMLFFMNNETPAEWVLGQIDCREEESVFGLALEGQGLCEVKFRNGVRGVLFTGHDSDIGCEIRLIGTEGWIELHNRSPHLRLRGAGDAKKWTPEGASLAEGLHGMLAIDRALADVADCLESGAEPELSSHKAIRSTEIIFATYESSRRRGRIDLPLTTEDSAFLSMLAAGEIGPKRAAA
jgi:predicted dehydrogenase